MSGRIKGITVVLDGDATGLSKALQSVNSDIRKTQSQLKDVEKLLKMDPGNTELLTQKQRLLNTAISETREKLQTLKIASEQANEALAKGEISQEQYDALQREIQETEHALRSLEQQAGQAATAVQKVALAGEKIKSAGKSISNLGTSLLPVTAAVVATGTAGVKAAASWETAFTGVKKTVDATAEEYEALGAGIQKMATETASTMEEIAGVAEVAGQLGIAKDSLLDFTKVMVMLGDTTNLSAADAATNLARFINITGDSQDSVDRLGASIVDLGNNFATDEASIVAMATRLASAGTLAGLTSTEILALSTAMSSVGIQAEAGGTAMTQTLTAIEAAVADFSVGSMESLDKIAEVANMSSESFASAWKNEPITAIQSFIKGLGELDEKGESATLVLDELGMSGVRQSNMLKALALASGILTDAVETSSSAYKENTALVNEAEKRYATFDSQVSQLKESLKLIAIDIGQTLIPILQNLMGKIQSVVNWWKSLSDTQRRIIVDIGLLVGALGPALIVIGKVITAVGTIMTFVPKIAGFIYKLGTLLSALKGGLSALWGVLLANPIVLVIAVIAALVAAFIYFWNTSEEFRNFWINLWETIKNAAITAWNAIKEALSNIWTSLVSLAQRTWSGITSFFTKTWNKIKNTTISVWNAIGNFFKTTWNSIQTTVTTVVTAITEWLSVAWMNIQTTITTVWTAIYNFFVSIWYSIQSLVVSVMSSISGFLSSIWATITATISSFLNQILSSVISIFNQVVTAVRNAMNRVYNAIVNGFNRAVSFIKGLIGEAYSWGADMVSNIANGIKSMIGSIISACSSVASTIRSYLHFSVPDVGPLTDFESWMPDFMKGLAEGIEANRDLIQKAVSGVAADLMLNPKVAALEGMNLSGSSSKSVVQHTGTIRVEGVNNTGDLSGVVDIIIDQLRQEVRT